MAVIEFVNVRKHTRHDKWLRCYLMFVYRRKIVEVEGFEHNQKMAGCVPLRNVVLDGKKLLADPITVLVGGRFDNVYLVNEIDKERIVLWRWSNGKPVLLNKWGDVVLSFAWDKGYVVQF